MVVYLCPGYHSSALTDRFIQAVWPDLTTHNKDAESLKNPEISGIPEIIVFPSDRRPPYSPHAIVDHLCESLDKSLAGRAEAGAIAAPRVVWIGFSAGVVGGILAARQWHRAGHSVDKFIAIDGWGVPLGQRFPIYRMAHDAWTHHSQSWMGQGLRQMPGNSWGDRPHRSFIADPPVPHLDLWRSPDQVQGYLLPKTNPTNSCTAADCIRSWTNPG